MNYTELHNALIKRLELVAEQEHPTSKFEIHLEDFDITFVVDITWYNIVDEEEVDFHNHNVKIFCTDVIGSNIMKAKYYLETLYNK